MKWDKVDGSHEEESYDRLEEVISGGNTCSKGKKTHFGKALWSFFARGLGDFTLGGGAGHGLKQPSPNGKGWRPCFVHTNLQVCYAKDLYVACNPKHAKNE